MGSGESSTRKVSFGVDEEDRVRILRGVKLTEDVLQRMKGVANIAPVHKPPTPPPSPPKDSGAAPRPSTNTSSSPRAQSSPKPGRPQTSTKPPTTEANDTKEEKKRKAEKQHAVAQEELSKVARKESEAVRVDLSKALSRERQHTQQESEKAKLLPPEDVADWVQQLQKKDAELKALDAFYKEQVALLEKRNLERYGEAGVKFHDQATKSEAQIKTRGTEPVCPGLQTQILSCYKDNREETLRCADLAKEYMQCIHAAKKNLLVNHG